MFDEELQTILIVDDNTTNVKLIENILSHAPVRYRVLTALSGKGALDVCASDNIDLILLDINMPYLDGFQVCTILKQQPHTKNIPIFFLTARNDRESLMRGFEVGAVDYLTKPINTSELLARVEAHLKIRKQEKLLIEHNAAKERFISIIAEDLYTPITGLKKLLKMINESFDNMDQELIKDYISLAYNASDALNSLADNLMQWSKLKEGGLPINPKLMDLKNVIIEVISTLQTEYKQKHIEFKVNLPDGLIVYMDHESLQRVLRNILTNAIVFSNRNGVVEVTYDSGDASFTRIAIKDHGIGIDEEDKKKLFKIGEKLVKKGTDGEIGTGMGLILSYNLMEKSNGFLSLESEKNKGTTVYLGFPVGK